MSRIIKIGFIGHRTENPANDGIDYHVVNILRRLPVDKYEIHSYCHQPDSELDVRRFFHKSLLSKSSIFRPINALFGSILLRCHGVKLIHFHGLNSTLFLPVIALFVPRIVFTLHSDDWNYPKWGRAAKFVLKLSHYMRRFASRVIHISPYYRKIYGRPNDVLIYSGVFNSNISASNCVKSLDVVDEVAVVGRITPEKRQLEISKALAGCDVKVNFFGTCGDDDYSRRFLDEVNKSENLFFHGCVNNDDLRLILAQNYYVNFSSFEGLSIANIEGSVIAKGFLLSDIPANRSIDDFDESAFVRNVDELRCHVESGGWYVLSEERKRDLATKFSWDCCIGSLCDLYESDMLISGSN